MRVRFRHLALLMLIHPPALHARPVVSADLLLTNGRVITMDQKNPRAEAIAVKGDRFVWIGTTQGARASVRAKRTVDLRGATVFPGIVDAHTHLMSLGESFLKVDLKNVPTPEEAIRRIKARATTARPGEWILGWGWDEGSWAAHYPTHNALTAAVPNNPVVLTGLHSFASWVNKKALDIAGITKATPDPENGRIIRDERTGEPTGILTNRAQDLVSKHLPALNIIQVKKALELAAAECVRNGLTSVHEARVSPLMIRAFRDLIREGRMPLRVYGMLDGADKQLVDEWLTRGPEVDSTNHRFTIRSIKIFADGALGSRGAALSEPYSDQPATRGVVTTTESDLYSLTRRALSKGFQVATHAIGDFANHFVLNAYERATKEVPQAKDARLRIEHAQVVAPSDVPRFAQLGVIASMQPVHCTSDMEWAEKRIGPARIKGAYSWRWLIQSGARVPVSSDFPGETLNPFYTIYAAITRQDPSGTPAGGWHPEQKMTLEEVLRGYTMEAAYAEFEEDSKGSIEVGKLADMIVISGDITALPPKDTLSIRVMKTYVGGRLVHSATR